MLKKLLRSTVLLKTVRWAAPKAWRMIQQKMKKRKA